MAKKQSNPIEVLREKGIDVEKMNMSPEQRKNFEAFKRELALRNEEYNKGLKEGKATLAQRAGGALLTNPITKGVVVGGLTTYGVLTGLKLANIQPTWLRAGQLDTASDATAQWLRGWTTPKTGSGL
jgi:hypothetical protein